MDEDEINHIKLFYNKIRLLGFEKKIKYFDQFQIYNNDKYNLFFDLLSGHCSEENLLSPSEETLFKK